MYKPVFKPFAQPDPEQSLTARLADEGYWIARLALLVHNAEYAKAVSLCRERVEDARRFLSAGLLYARALAATGQREAAIEQLYDVLTRDPDNQAALKLLADCQFAEGDEATAMLAYERIQQIEPECRSLLCSISRRPESATRTLMLSRGREKAAADDRRFSPAFVTETLGDLYLDQGHYGMAAEIYRRLSERNPHTRIKDKLDRALAKTREKESNHVQKTN